jgi:hypothetical protein
MEYLAGFITVGLIMLAVVAVADSVRGSQS